MTDAVIVSAVRTAVGKAPKGTLRATRPDEMAATVIGEALKRAPGIEPSEVEDVILGCAMPEGEQGMNVARIASLRAGVPIDASAVTINRFCSSGLQAIAFGAERIMVGAADTIVAGGTESMSLIPMGGNKIAPNPNAVSARRNNRPVKSTKKPERKNKGPTPLGASHWAISPTPTSPRPISRVVPLAKPKARGRAPDCFGVSGIFGVGAVACSPLSSRPQCSQTMAAS